MKALYTALSCALFLGIALSLQMTVFKSSEKPQPKFDFGGYEFGDYHFKMVEASVIEPEAIETKTPEPTAIKPTFVLEEHDHPILGKIWFFVGPRGKALGERSLEVCEPFSKGKEIYEIPQGIPGARLLYIK